MEEGPREHLYLDLYRYIFVIVNYDDEDAG